MNVDFTNILVVVSKGLNVINTLVKQGKAAGPAITAIKNLVESAKGGNMTNAQIASTEAELDKLIDDFNQPMD